MPPESRNLPPRFERTLAPVLRARAREYRLVFLTGPRQSGKTTLARQALPDAAYVSLEDPSVRRRAVDDPRGFLWGLSRGPGAILDEVQNVPELFSYLQGMVDDGTSGPWVLTGSQQFLLSERIGQSLAGRAAVLELLPLSLAERLGRGARRIDDLARPSPERPSTPGVPFPQPNSPSQPPRTPQPEPQPEPQRPSADEALFAGMYPEIHARSLDPRVWFDSYLRTYVERDVRTLRNVGDYDTFTRFVRLCAGRTGSLLSLSSLGSDAGVSHTTARAWISILRASYVVELLPVHARNFSKRLIKSPKLYFHDTGLACALLGIRDAADLSGHPLRGALFETFVFSELWKMATHHGERPRLAFWRDSAGHEVDFVADLGPRIFPIECKSGQTVSPDAFSGLDYFARLSRASSGLLVSGGDEAFTHRAWSVRPWWDLS